MSIDYATQIDPLYASDVITDPEYLAVLASNRDQVSEQRILTTIEILRAHLASMLSEEEARLFHYCVARMLAGVPYSDVFSDLTIRVSGNVEVPGSNFENGDTVDVTTATGTASVVLVGGPFVDLDAVVADINSLLIGNIPSITEVEAYNNGGKLAFRNTSGNEGEVFTLAFASDPDILNKAGISPGTFYNEIQNRANIARDDALSHFERDGRPEDSVLGP